ncbi:MAG: peptidyl-tRNA hydrolase Pth2 [Thermoplasmataceae archaeon]|jgi:PTH2 family peptidyl-tRNA hydrolase
MVGPVKLVIAVRRDLDMGKGKIAAQVAHASVSCALTAQKTEKKLFKEWISEGQKKIVIKVDGEEQLRQLIGLARSQGIITEPINDAGFTQVFPGTLTCAGIGPAEESVLESLTGKYPLL